jgi:serine/threonine protein phosphatase 1
MTDDYQAVKRFPMNTQGRDYVVGDIHGEFAQLERVLESLGFDPGRDRLFSVGDLIDRGADSPAALAWLRKPWFHAILGNHEEMALDATTNPDTFFWWTRVNGGEWWLAQNDSLRETMLEAFRTLPLAMEVAAADGKAGIVHADMPQGMDWERFVERLTKGDTRVRETALWGRTRARGGNAESVAGIDRVYCGHTPVDAPQVVGNVCFVDTGACYGNRLTVLAMDQPLPQPVHRPW